MVFTTHGKLGIKYGYNITNYKMSGEGDPTNKVMIGDWVRKTNNVDGKQTFYWEHKNDKNLGLWEEKIDNRDGRQYYFNSKLKDNEGHHLKSWDNPNREAEKEAQRKEKEARAEAKRKEKEVRAEAKEAKIKEKEAREEAAPPHAPTTTPPPPSPLSSSSSPAPDTTHTPTTQTPVQVPDTDTASKILTQISDVSTKWNITWDDQSKRLIYSDQNGKIQFEKPDEITQEPDIPPDWLKVFSNKHNHYYYTNEKINKSQWEKPTTKGGSSNKTKKHVSKIYKRKTFKSMKKQTQKFKSYKKRTIKKR